MTEKRQAPKATPINLVRSAYQPSRAELEAPIEFPSGTTPDDLAKAIMRPVKIDWKSRTE